MISGIEIELLDNRINIDKASLLHGVLMENIDTHYAAFLHSEGLRPYSQTVIKKDGKTFWRVNTLNEQAYEQIAKRLLDPSFDHIYIRHNRMDVCLGRKKYESLSYQELADHYAYGQAVNNVKVRFLTPTSFKRDGKYYNIPETRMIFNSLINKFNVYSGGKFDNSRELVNMIAEAVSIDNYNFRSCGFRLEGTAIPAFMGNMGYKIAADDNIKKIACMLLEYGRFCGVGTKTAIGMGAIETE